ncbi:MULTISPECIES: alpha-amylase family protein [Micromonospora]|uniref:Maltose alpha-D-glucosyltransferase/ alpha-amylase n=1 Tax=Micromonospora rifamycinica TaxID=291594 RepID=A0A120F8A7_9ACTN|nr:MULTISPECIES: alpha-amylase family protein [Micromonospora]KWV31491.1 trehalose synthase [Micromonospora rifamycinica]WFE62081.1 alpha-amylase family protein [Micromonospora sp. WMMD714]SCG79904.1 maltose alpha-D-glucosyltransferase/ alpha-amylase [Micromonospora rifamycinica]
MGDRWYSEAVVYCLDVDTYADSDGDGIGDFRGLIGRLDYLARLGVTCLWLNPIHPSPNQDDGYDATDFYNVDPRLGTLGDFAELLHQARNRGIRVIIDLVVNHTSDQHPWFQSARSSPDSPYRDWYVWADHEPADRHQGMVFPGEQHETWSYDRTAKAWYYHRFYRFQPDLNIENPKVRAEIKKITSFWLQLGVSGFRMDAVPFIIEQTEPGNPNAPKDFDFLTDLRQHVQWRRGDAVLLAEANVEPDQLPVYFGDGSGSGNRIHMLFDFMLNGRLMLALAREDPEAIIDALRDTPKLPTGGQWATFLRNHDEIDLSRLTADQRNDVLAKFGPDENMQLYGRGIRRRLAPMLGNDRRHIELAYALQFSLRGTPVLRYGEEIGMGENLALDGRDAIRTPMQWSYKENAGFSTADPEKLIRPVIDQGDFGYQKVNVTAQRGDATSLLAWFERMIRTLREAPEIGSGSTSHIDVPMPAGVLAHRADGPTGTMVFLHNLGTEDVEVDLSSVAPEADLPIDVLTDRGYGDVGKLDSLKLAGHGYRWIRLCRSTGY